MKTFFIGTPARPHGHVYQTRHIKNFTLMQCLLHKIIVFDIIFCLL